MRLSLYVPDSDKEVLNKLIPLSKKQDLSAYIVKLVHQDIEKKDDIEIKIEEIVKKCLENKISPKEEDLKEEKDCLLDVNL